MARRQRAAVRGYGVPCAAAPPSSQPTIQLAYAAPGECPDALAVRAGVIAQLGYDPVTADAPRTIAIAITRVAAGYQAVVTLATPGQPPSTETISAVLP